ncbi:MAG: hypothetical protein LBG57_06780 [Treponema sp.]|nr:hypothetical protein [Treponema sp.]
MIDLLNSQAILSSKTKYPQLYVKKHRQGTPKVKFFTSGLATGFETARKSGLPAACNLYPQDRLKQLTAAFKISRESI